MSSSVIQWLQTSGWKVVVILLIWLLANSTVSRFGQQFIALVLTKERAMLRQRHRVLSTHDQQRIATLSGVLSSVMRATLMIIFGSMILTELGIPVVPIFAGAGIIGITIGFGAQSLIKDVLAGLFIVLENQYAKGDRIKLGEVIGSVEDVSLRTTVIRGADQVLHYIPNGSITVISNYSKDL